MFDFLAGWYSSMPCLFTKFCVEVISVDACFRKNVWWCSSQHIQINELFIFCVYYISHMINVLASFILGSDGNLLYLK